MKGGEVKNLATVSSEELTAELDRRRAADTSEHAAASRAAYEDETYKVLLKDSSNMFSQSQRLREKAERYWHEVYEAHRKRVS
jgi:hypothetical protein